MTLWLDANDTFRVLNAWINEINLERTVAAIAQ